jgi:hypothetical protein
MQVPNAAGRAAVTEMYDLRKKADQACERGRYARAEELFQRALAVAEAAVPPDSLLIVRAMLQLQGTLLHADTAGWTARQNAIHLLNAWQNDASLLPMARRCLRMLDARWRAGTLFQPTPAEVFYCDVIKADLPSRTCGGMLLMRVARTAFYYWPPLRTPGEEEERLRGLHSALQAAVELDARFREEQRIAPDDAMAAYKDCDSQTMMETFLGGPLRDTAVLSQLRSVCGLSREDEAAARRLLAALKQPADAEASALAGVHGMQADPAQTAQHARQAEQRRRRASADVALHGLRRCALASCDAVEAHVAHFKTCAGCRGVAYCSKEHQSADWRSHKAACKAARDAATAAEA